MVVVMMTLFALVVVGYVAGKLGYLGGDFDRQLSRLVINITCPALILSSAMTGVLPDRRLILPLLLISVITYAILTAIAFVLPKYLTKNKDDEGAIGFALMFGNVGFMGYPVVASILITGKGEIKGKRFQKKVLYSTPMLAAYLTMAIVALEINNIPEAISQPLTMLGNITVPAALLIIGSSMSNLPLRSLLGNRSVYATTLFRLALLPIGIHFLMGVLGFSPLVVNINTLVIAMPVATYGTILCLKYEKDTTMITRVTFITTLLSMLSIPALTLLFF